MESTMSRLSKAKSNGHLPPVDLSKPPRNFHGKKRKYDPPAPFMKRDPRLSKAQAGRPKLLGDLRALARYYTEDAIFTIYEIMANAKVHPTVRLEAAQALLDRGWGKAETTANIRVTDAPIRDLTTTEILGLLAIEGITPDTASATVVDG
jgi:hypothetical protein